MPDEPHAIVRARVDYWLSSARANIVKSERARLAGDSVEFATYRALALGEQGCASDILRLALNEHAPLFCDVEHQAREDAGLLASANRHVCTKCGARRAA